MINFDLEKTKELLSGTGSIIEKHEAIARETGRNFNIFDVARIDDKEVIVCRVLAELLNPKGRHGQGGAYLKLFLHDCLKLHEEISEEETENMRVTLEHFTNNGRPIDIVIEGNGKFIPIEVKIYADDQSRQCYDYCKFAQTKDSTAKIVYLTLYGDMPSDDSKGKLTDDDIIPLSFDYHVINWLEKCLAMPDTIRKTPIREMLIQFITAIKKITNQLEDKPMNEIIKVLSASEQNMRNAKTIADTFENCRTEIIKKFFYAFDERFRKKINIERANIEWDYDTSKEAGAYISYIFEKNDEHNITIVFSMYDDQYDNLNVCFQMMENGEQKCFGNKAKVDSLRKYYGVENTQKRCDWRICWEYIMFENEQINLRDFHGSYDNYFKLFDPVKFDEIVDSAVEQAQIVFSKLK